MAEAALKLQSPCDNCRDREGCQEICPALETLLPSPYRDTWQENEHEIPVGLHPDPQIMRARRSHKK